MSLVRVGLRAIDGEQLCETLEKRETRKESPFRAMMLPAFRNVSKKTPLKNAVSLLRLEILGLISAQPMVPWPGPSHHVVSTVEPLQRASSRC
jgi:hypothetical protein